MSRRPAALVIFFVGLTTLAASAASAPVDGVAGAWDFHVTRPEGSVPRVAQAILDFRPTPEGWAGAIRFRKMFAHRTLRLEGVIIDSKGIEARLPSRGSDIVIRGELKDDALTGNLDWGEGAPLLWGATRPGAFYEPGWRSPGSRRRGDASRCGLDEEALRRLVSAARDAYSDALVVVKDGRVVVDRTFGHPPGPIALGSITEFVTALGVALLLEEKKVASLDAPLSTWFPEYAEGKRAGVTLRHVLAHVSGLSTATDATLDAATDRVAAALAGAVEGDPGATHAPTAAGAALLAGIFPRVVGRQEDDYVNRGLFRPLLIKDWSWARDEAGTTMGDRGLALWASDLARIGRLVIEDGKAGRRDLISPALLREFARPATNLVKDQGLLWRLIAHGKTVDGIGVRSHPGQWLVIMPEKRLVAVRLRRVEEGTEEDPAETAFDAFPELLRAVVK